MKRVRLLSRLLDEQFRIPGTTYRVGLDGLLSMIPGVGDTAGALLSAYILYEAIRLGAPKTVLLRMVANIGIDTVLGAIPVAGDIFDVAWKANKKNTTLLHAYLASPRLAAHIVIPRDISGNYEHHQHEQAHSPDSAVRSPCC